LAEPTKIYPGAPLYLKEQTLYGSARLGTINRNEVIHMHGIVTAYNWLNPTPTTQEAFETAIAEDPSLAKPLYFVETHEKLSAEPVYDPKTETYAYKAEVVTEEEKLTEEKYREVFPVPEDSGIPANPSPDFGNTMVKEKYAIFGIVRGFKQYELSNHLGNVLTTISDKKGFESATGPMVNNDTPHYYAEILSAQDYYPGGMLMPGRNFNANSYRYGYNKGSEKDDEISGSGNHFTTKFREGDTRLLIWWSSDPKADLQPHQAPYSYMDGNPILLNDPDGDCPPGTPCGDVVKNPTISSDNGGKNNNRFRMGNRTKGHEGVDILASKGTSLQNVIFGKVVYAKNNHTSDEYSGSRRVDANGKKISKAPTTGLGNSLVIEHTLETDYTFQSAGKEVTLAKGMRVYIRYSHLDKVDEGLLGKDVGVGVEIGKAGATGNPGLYQGRWGISAENRHVHIEASTSKDFSDSSRIDPEAFMNTKYDKQGNAISSEAPKK